MKAVVQRVKRASVSIDGSIYSQINSGMLVLFCVEKGDTEDKFEWIANKIIALRCFDDRNGKMNLSLKDVNGEILVVSQFTLAADCKKGTRPGFDRAEKPADAKKMYEEFIDYIRSNNINVKTGVFGAMMQIELTNDGPVTFILEK